MGTATFFSLFFLLVNFLIVIMLSMKFSIFFAAAISLIFAFSLTFWSQATIAKGGIYTLNLFFIVIIFYVLVLAELKAKKYYLYLFSFLTGLSLANHHTAVLAIPSYVLFILLSDNLRKHINLKFFINSFLFFTAGLLVYLYLPISAASSPFINWGNPDNLERFISHILREQYGGARTIFTIEAYFKQIIAYFKSMSNNVTLFLILLIPFGMFYQFKKNKKIFIATIILFLSMTFILMLKVEHTVTPHFVYMNAPFFIPSYFICFIWIFYGIKMLLEKMPEKLNILRIIPLFLFLIPLRLNFFLNDRSKNFIVYDYGINILKTLKQKDTLFSSGDHSTFVLCYLSAVEGRGKNINIYDETGTVFKNIYGSDFLKISIGEHKRRLDFIQKKIINESNGSVYFILGSNLQNKPDITYFPYGLLYKVKKSEEDKSVFVWNYPATGLDDNNIFKDYLTLDLVLQYKFARAENLYYYGKTDEAKIDYDAVFLNGRDIDTIQNLIAFVYLRSEFKDSIPEKVIEYLSDTPDSAESHNNLANLYFNKNLIDKAIEEYKRAIMLDEKNSTSYYNLGICYLRKEDYKEAEENFKKALNLDPDNVDIYINLGLSLYHRQDKLIEAEECYKKALEYNQDIYEAHFNLGNIYLKQKRFNDAESEYIKTLRINDKYPYAYNNLGVVYGYLGRLKEASFYYRKALEIKPDYTEARKNFNDILKYLEK